MLIAATTTYAAKNNFQFQISNYHTQRQGGQTLDLYVRYAIKDGTDYSKYPDYRQLRNMTLPYLEPSKELPVNTFWEKIVSKMAKQLKSHYSLAGISVQLLVYPNKNGNISEPGFHGPIYTIGDVIPLSQVVIPTASNE